MNVTENAAGDRWCPMVRAAADSKDHNACNALVQNEEVRTPAFSMCVGSACMMWRWTEPAPTPVRQIADVPKALTPADAGMPPYDPEHWTFMPWDEEEEQLAHWREHADHAAERRRGYCGLAGRPEFIV